MKAKEVYMGGAVFLLLAAAEMKRREDAPKGTIRMLSKKKDVKKKKTVDMDILVIHQDIVLTNI